MTSKPIYFCVYRITNLVENKHYYGYKSSSIHPSKVIGITYFSSLTKDEGKAFRKDQKENPQNYKYKIVQMFSNKKEALAREIRLHDKFDVAKNPNFYHKAKQTSTGFDTTGKVTVRDKNGNYFSVDIDDPRRLTGELFGASKGRICPEEEKRKIAATAKNNAATGIIFGPTHRANLSKGCTGIPKSKEHINSMLETKKRLKIGMGKNHPRFKYYYRTPWGIFDSPEALEPEFTMSRMKNFCITSDKKMYPSVYKNCLKLQETFDSSCVGKTYKELGFWVIPKEEYNPEIDY